MSGVVVLRELLTVSAPLLVKVPEDRIIGDDLPEGIEIPAISIFSVDDDKDHKPLAQGQSRRMRERVQLTILAADASDRLDIKTLARRAADARIGDFGEVTAVSVQYAGGGPDFTTEAGLRGGSIDFEVSWNEAA